MNLIQKCNYCYKEYIPKRRGVQKYCSNTCRSKNWKHKQPQQQKSVIEVTNLSQTQQEKPIATNKISMSGIGNAAIGVATVEAVKSLLTPENRKAATKEDINKVISLITGQRYFPVKNIINDNYGNTPFYDIETAQIIYLKN